MSELRKPRICGRFEFNKLVAINNLYKHYTCSENMTIHGHVDNSIIWLDRSWQSNKYGERAGNPEDA